MHFSARGHTVTVQANKVSKDIFNIARGRFNLQTTPVEISDYDLIWSQHGQFLHNMANPNLLLNWRGAFISVHLSYYHPIETYHYPIAKRFSSLRVFNADVTRDLLDGSDQSPDALVLRNAAPLKFHREPKKYLQKLSRILVVSNHLPSELFDAIKHLDRNGIDVKIIGQKYNSKIIEPRDFSDVQAVISIGKTVQYALVSGLPVFCYDHFGGPGWLNDSNFERAEYFNFNGTCSASKMTSEDIAQYIVSGYEEAFAFSQRKWRYHSDRYNLDRHLDEILSRNKLNNISNMSDIEQIDTLRKFAERNIVIEKKLRKNRKIVVYLALLCVLLFAGVVAKL